MSNYKPDEEFLPRLDDYKTDPENPTDFIDADGCCHDDPGDLLQTALLRFCGCGSPEDNLIYVLGGMTLAEEKGPDGYEAFSAWWHDKEKREIAHFGSEAAARFFHYWLDKEHLTEHGSALPGWLSKRGKSLLVLLREWKAEYVPDEPPA